MTALRSACFAAVLCALVVCAEPARASGGGLLLPEPDEAVFTGIGYGMLAAPGILIGEAMLGAELNSVFIAPPYSWINLLGGIALFSVAVATEPHTSRAAVERGVAAGVTGFIVGTHGALSLLSWFVDREVWDRGVALALTLQPRAGPSLYLRAEL